MRPPILPISVDKLDETFGGKAMEILPPMSEIPEAFKQDSNPWVKWQTDWFYRGLEKLPQAKEGIDRDLALANLKCVQSSWEPKHQHKKAGVAYLAHLWFVEPT